MGSIRLYVVEKIKDAHVSNEPFDRDAAFNLQAFANRAFGVFQNEEESRTRLVHLSKDLPHDWHAQRQVLGLAA